MPGTRRPVGIADRGATLAALVSTRPGLAAAFDRLGIDYCCHGDRTLAEACAAAGIPLERVLGDLAAAEPAGGDAASWRLLDAAGLVDHIESTHHRYLRRELPELVALSSKVASVHGERHRELDQVRGLVGELATSLLPHLDEEERRVFPPIRSLAAGRCGEDDAAIAGALGSLDDEHEQVGELLRHVRSSTAGFLVPDDGCASYRLLYERLGALESDTHLHVMKESSFLFPAALELAAGAVAG